MKSEEIIEHAKRMATELRSSPRGLIVNTEGPFAQACEFLRSYAGEKTSFYQSVQGASKYFGEERNIAIASILESFSDYIESGLADEITPVRQAKLDVVSDLLDQAKSLLEDSKVHPAAPAVIIGATLEEFLRAWIEEEAISIGNSKHGLDTYTKCLRKEAIISKQDVKDLTAWAGIRNYAAHGEWTEVEDKEKISLMLQGVNLFMRKYEKG